MGRTVPTFRWALAQEESEWKLYRNHLPKNERKDFDVQVTNAHLILFVPER